MVIYTFTPKDAEFIIPGETWYTAGNGKVVYEVDNFLAESGWSTTATKARSYFIFKDHQEAFEWLLSED
jgi:hypothetical protein